MTNENQVDYEKDLYNKLKSTYKNELQKQNIYLNTDNYSGMIENLNIELLMNSNKFVRTFDCDLNTGTGLIEKTKKLIKRVIRKSINFITRPYADNMLAYQESNLELIGNIFEVVAKNTEDIKKLGNENNYLLDKIELINSENKEKIELLNSELAISEQKNVEMFEQLRRKFDDFRMSDEEYILTSYSQAGEDKIIDFALQYLGIPKKGLTYLDIGCNHYKDLNNTYYFYAKGFRGVLIDANPIFTEELKIKRPEDTILNVGVGNETGLELPFYIVNGDGISSFNKESVENAIKQTSWLKIEKEILVPIVSVNDIIKDYFFNVPTIISLDIEGYEMEVLKSVDMDKYRPLFYIIETIEYRNKLDLNNKRMDIVDFMVNNGYKEYAFTGVNSIFIDEKYVISLGVDV